MHRYRLIRKDALDAAARATAKPLALGEVDVDMLVELLLPSSMLRSRTQLRMQLEDEMAAAMEKAMRGETGSFLDIFEYIPDGMEAGGIHKVRREPGPLLRELADSHCFVPIRPEEVVPQPLLVRDLRTGATNERLSPGGGAELRGIDVRINASATDEGIFLVDSFDNVEYSLTVEAPSDADAPTGMQTICFTTPPDLPGGDYFLEVRNRPAGHALRSGRLPVQLRVESPA